MNKLISPTLPLPTRGRRTQDKRRTHRLSWRIKTLRTRATTRSKIRSTYSEGEATRSEIGSTYSEREATRSEIGSVYSERIAKAATGFNSRRNLSTHSSITEEEEKTPKSEAPA